MNPEGNNTKEYAALCRKLNAARAMFHAAKLTKSGRNEFAGYDYFEMSDFVPMALHEFFQAGLCGIVSFTPEVATLRITDVESGAYLDITSPMREAALKGCHPIQNLGAVETYQRRYLWAAAMELIETSVVDSSKPVEAPAKAAPAAPAKAPAAPARPQQPQQQTLPGAAPEWQDWVTNVVSYRATERNGRIYTNVKFGNGYEAVTTEQDIASVVSVAQEKGTMMDIKVKQGQKGAKTWWWLEDIQEHEEDTEEVPA